MEKRFYKCPACSADNAWSLDRCCVCKADLGPPLRRELLRAEEKDALDKRYAAAWAAASAEGYGTKLKDFEVEVQSNSVATINVWPAFLDQMLSGGALYSGYSRLVSSEVRWPGARDDDQARTAVESILFGSLAAEIRYAALSMDGRGLLSYGSCTIVLREMMVAASATLLEDNSYKFVRDRQLMFDSNIPAGYRATWEDRHKLVVSKLGARIAAAQPPINSAGILLFSEGDRQTDIFVEIHIWGPFDQQSIDWVRIPDPQGAADDQKFYLLKIRDQMKNRNQRCEIA